MGTGAKIGQRRDTQIPGTLMITHRPEQNARASKGASTSASVRLDVGRLDTDGLTKRKNLFSGGARVLELMSGVEVPLTMSLTDLQRIAAVVEFSDDAIITKDLNGIITSWNPGAQRLFGYAAEEAVGRPVTILIPPERHDEEPAILQRIRRGERIDHYETVRRRKDGSYVDISLTVSPIKDAQGAVVGASKIARDISARKLVEAYEQRISAIVHSSDDAIISTDLNGIINSWNPGAQRIYGYSAEEVIGKQVIVLLPPERQTEELAILERIRRGEHVDHFETVRRRKDGSLIDISLTVSPIRNAKGVVVGASKIARDVTERKKTEGLVAILAREAEHRAKNMLAVVQAMVRLSQSDTPDGLKQVLEGRIRALANVHTLFVQSRWAGAELRKLVEEELTPYGRVGERASIAGPAVLLTQDAAQTLALTMHELSTNAAKYGALSVMGGNIDVKWSRSADDKMLVIRWTENGGPPVHAPSRVGIGTRVVESMIGGIRGELQFNWPTKGFECEIILPMSDVEFVV
jgi:PAS domain S-box-containing protein